MPSLAIACLTQRLAKYKGVMLKWMLVNLEAKEGEKARKMEDDNTTLDCPGLLQSPFYMYLHCTYAVYCVATRILST